MDFNKIPTIQDAQFYLDIAFKRAKKTAHSRRTSLRDEKKEKQRKIEIARVSTSRDVLANKLFEIGDKFPSMNNLGSFYEKLIKLTVPYNEVKQALASVRWTAQKINKLGGDAQNKIDEAEKISEMKKYRKAFYGRASSLLQDIDDELKVLMEARKEMIEYPIIKDLPTVAITGFPNVGKTTLLKHLTGSAPEIKSYAFTTKRLNLGYEHINDEKIQFIDTPGTLSRPDKRNKIEKQAHLAMEEAADLLVYVWDLTEPFSMEDQKRLFENVKEMNKPVIEFLTKKDLLSEEKIEEFKKYRPVITELDELKEKIVENV